MRFQGLLFSVVVVGAACEPTIPVTGSRCNVDADCGSGHYCEENAKLISVEEGQGVCLPGDRPSKVVVNQPAFARSGLIVAENGSTESGTFVVIDPDRDPIQFVEIRDLAITGYGSLSVDIDGNWSFSALGQPSSPTRVAVTAVEHAKDGDHDIDVGVFVVVVDGGGGLLTWSGVESEDMSFAANWTGGGAPDANRSVLLTPRTPHDPSPVVAVDVLDFFSPAVPIGDGGAVVRANGLQVFSNAIWPAGSVFEVVDAASVAGTFGILTARDRVCVAAAIDAGSAAGLFDVRGSSLLLAAGGEVDVVLDGEGVGCDGVTAVARAGTVGSTGGVLTLGSRSVLGSGLVVAGGDVVANVGDQRGWTLVLDGATAQNVSARHVLDVDQKSGDLRFAGETQVHGRLTLRGPARVEPGTPVFVKQLLITAPLIDSNDSEGQLFAEDCTLIPSFVRGSLPSWIVCNADEDAVVFATEGEGEEGEGDVGEGEGDVGEGEGEGDVGEGEGEGEGEGDGGEGEGDGGEGEGEGDPCDVIGTGDGDGDGVNDHDECVGGSDEDDACDPSVTADPCDDDGDGLDSAAERDCRSNPGLVDTDGDGQDDDAECPDDRDGDGVGDALEPGAEADDPCFPSVLAATCERDGCDFPTEDDDRDNVLNGDECGQPDGNGNGLIAILDACEPNRSIVQFLDTDNDTANDEVEGRCDANGPRNSDGTGLFDFETNDEDGDVLDRQFEQSIGSNPVVADSDGDGVNDGAEQAGDSDEDRDNVNDAIESNAGGGSNNNGVAPQFDACEPNRSIVQFLDTDNDTANDEVEGRCDSGGPRNTDGAGAFDFQTNDEDGDGLDRQFEQSIGSSPVDADSDDDGSNDGAEQAGDSDEDRDNVNDAIESSLGGGSNNNGVAPQLDACEPNRSIVQFLDTDNDTANDENEGRCNGGGPRNTDGVGAFDFQTNDEDGDGLDRQFEQSIGSNPLLRDSDGDGDNDGAEQIGDSDEDRDNVNDAIESRLGGGTNNNGVAPQFDACEPNRNIVQFLDTDNDTANDENEGRCNVGGPRNTDGIGAADFQTNDEDGDTLDRQFEQSIGSNPLDSDSDDDGILDGAEQVGSSDDDGDNVNDAIESNLAGADTNGNGIAPQQDPCEPNASAFGCAGGGEGEGEGEPPDGLDDAVEHNEEASALSCLGTDFGGPPPGLSNSDLLDIDRDGIPNDDDFDADGDGLGDGFEGIGDADLDCLPAFLDVDDHVASGGKCIPLQNPRTCPLPPGVDTDHDGILDSVETTRVSNPNDPDSDHDGIWDTWEIRDADELFALGGISQTDAEDVDCDLIKNWFDVDSDNPLNTGPNDDHNERRLSPFNQDAPPRPYLTPGPGPRLACSSSGGELPDGGPPP